MPHHHHHVMPLTHALEGALCVTVVSQFRTSVRVARPPSDRAPECAGEGVHDPRRVRLLKCLVMTHRIPASSPDVRVRSSPTQRVGSRCSTCPGASAVGGRGGIGSAGLGGSRRVGSVHGRPMAGRKSLLRLRIGECTRDPLVTFTCPGASELASHCRRTASPISRADVRTATVKPKKGLKSWVADMLVKKRPGRLLCIPRSRAG